VLIDKDLKLPKTAKIFSKEAKTLVFTEKSVEKSSDHLEHVRIDFSQAIIPQILKVLHQKGIQSLIVEGGRHTLQSFIDLNLWDEARIFKTKVIFQDGTRAPEFMTDNCQSEMILKDELKIFKN
jgi:diaminohydroxyphosphoribosylaminopyrimidine deaminase/5-amino-6-(5-phosphoribosylamino)uracil reductase